MEIDVSAIAGKLKAYRYRNGLSHKQLGKILGIDGSTICAWEKAERVPPQKKLNKLILLMKL
ncbi:hypothetical protein BFS30_24750 [Pedobacter steynii]|uniref:HTH cro/C1-type domain-containing protein n=1 Tax=Pedobacter steynii TaxID=430522 RepID=A0A1D7QN51_9SPHI|nr:hypothetical protein BFS30_24750 [Pedobacter steynii]